MNFAKITQLLIKHNIHLSAARVVRVLPPERAAINQVNNGVVPHFGTTNMEWVLPMTQLHLPSHLKFLENVYESIQTPNQVGNPWWHIASDQVGDGFFDKIAE